MPSTTLKSSALSAMNGDSTPGSRSRGHTRASSGSRPRPQTRCDSTSAAFQQLAHELLQRARVLRAAEAQQPPEGVAFLVADRADPRGIAGRGKQLAHAAAQSARSRGSGSSLCARIRAASLKNPLLGSRPESLKNATCRRAAKKPSSASRRAICVAGSCSSCRSSSSQRTRDAASRELRGRSAAVSAPAQAADRPRARSAARRPVPRRAPPGSVFTWSPMSPCRSLFRRSRARGASPRPAPRRTARDPACRRAGTCRMTRGPGARGRRARSGSPSARRSRGRQWPRARRRRSRASAPAPARCPRCARTGSRRAKHSVCGIAIASTRPSW